MLQAASVIANMFSNDEYPLMALFEDKIKSSPGMSSKQFRIVSSKTILYAPKKD